MSRVFRFRPATSALPPYAWGGGHGKWVEHGYDCWGSGSGSFVLASAGLLDRSLVAAEFMRWGEPGPGKWVTIYASPTHVFMRVAGIRFDTVARAQTGSRWVNEWTDTSRYVARHPSGPVGDVHALGQGDRLTSCARPD